MQLSLTASVRPLAQMPRWAQFIFMYNPKDIQFVGKYDYDKENALTDSGWNKTFSVGIFKWELKNNGKAMKKGKAVVRVSGLVVEKEKVFQMADSVVKQLDNGDWDGRKTVAIK